MTIVLVGMVRVNIYELRMDGVVSTVYRIPLNVKERVYTMSQQRIGFIQSRGLGDLIIALPIAREYTMRGYEVYWPVCEPFYQQMMRAAPWVRWMSVPVDEQGLFFYENPAKQLTAIGVTEHLWMYQYLSSHPEKTNKSHFAQFKFDQYKYAQAGVPFSRKWELKDCIDRDHERESKLYDQLVKKPRYMVYQQTASDLDYPIDLSVIDPEVQCIEIREVTDSIFDWIKILEGAETLILIDSVTANLVDQLGLAEDRDCYYIRKWNRRVDGNPVFLGDWTYVDVEDPEGVQVRSLVDTGIPATAPKPAPKQQQQGSTAGRTDSGAGQTYTPYGASNNTLNAAQRLQASLGLRK